jgi:hypothetical protein
MEVVMRRFALAMMLLVGATTMAFAAEIDAANAKWIEFFNKGDFVGIASL